MFALYFIIDAIVTVLPTISTVTTYLVDAIPSTRTSLPNAVSSAKFFLSVCLF